MTLDVPFIVPPIAIIHLIIILESALRPPEIIVYLGNAGLREFGAFCPLERRTK